MSRIHLGKNLDNGRKQFITTDDLRTHLHLVGATGAGKSNAILRILEYLTSDPIEKSCLFLIDPMGSLSRDFLNLLSGPYCTDSMRERLVYFEPAREDVVTSLNPLQHGTEGQRYYQVMRAMDIVLRAWDAQDLSQQPRLAQWMFNSFYAAASVGVPIGFCHYMLEPGSPEHDAILARMPERYRRQWQEILKARGEATRILESTRNRLKPFFESPNLRRMFSSKVSLFDCQRFIRERRIVVLNLGRYGRLAGRDSETIGGMILNEVFEAAYALSLNEGRAVVDPTYIVMDEFQKFVSPDIEEALPTVRQMGLRLVLAHQSFAQLERSEVDLSQMIWQARSRFIFANNAQDADIVADELAKLTFDAMRIKDIRYTTKQRVAGHRKIWLESEGTHRGETSSRTESSHRSQGRSFSQQDPIPGQPEPPPVHGQNWNDGISDGVSFGESVGYSTGRAASMLPVYEDVTEVASLTYGSFEEWAIEWGQRIRKSPTGHAYVMLPGQPEPASVQIAHSEPIITSKTDERREALIERNFNSDIFVSAAEADRIAEQYRYELLNGEFHEGSKPDDTPNSPFSL